MLIYSRLIFRICRWCSDQHRCSCSMSTIVFDRNIIYYFLLIIIIIVTQWRCTSTVVARRRRIGVTWNYLFDRENEKSNFRCFCVALRLITFTMMSSWLQSLFIITFSLYFSLFANQIVFLLSIAANHCIIYRYVESISFIKFTFNIAPSSSSSSSPKIWFGCGGRSIMKQQRLTNRKQRKKQTRSM